MMKIDITEWSPFHLYDERLFTIDSGNKFDRGKMSSANPTINFVGRTEINNGINAYVDEIDTNPYPAGCITVALGGSIGATFVQPRPFYTSQNVVVLIPNHEMSDECKWFICAEIWKESNMHYQAFVKELNAHIKRDFEIPLPVDTDGNPDWSYIESYMRVIEVKAKNNLNALRATKGDIEKIDTEAWGEFKASDLFEINKGKRLTSVQRFEGDTPYIGALNHDNGLYQFIRQEPIFHGNSITVNYNSSAIGYAYYQEKDFWATDDVNVWYFRESNNYEFNKYIALFVCPIIKQLGSAYKYTNKWKIDDMKNCKLRLPVTLHGKPDWQYMEKYIKQIESKARKNLDWLML